MTAEIFLMKNANIFLINIYFINKYSVWINKYDEFVNGAWIHHLVNYRSRIQWLEIVESENFAARLRHQAQGYQNQKNFARFRH